MRKDQQEELRRLEQALLEADAQEASTSEEDSDAWLEEIFQEFNDEAEEEYTPDYDVYNTDSADVDMDEYSEAVRDVPSKPGCALPVFLILIAVLGGLTLWFLKKWGLV